MSKTLLSIATFLFPVIAWSIPITFDLLTLVTDDNDNVPSISITQQGLTTTLTANTGVINRTSSAVGINSSCSSDNTDEMDSICPNTPPEQIGVSFDQSVNFLSFNVSRFSTGDQGVFVSEENNFSLAFNQRGDYLPTIGGLPLTISAGQTFYIGAMASGTDLVGNGFSFNSFTIDTIVSEPDVIAVSEPSVFLLMFTAGGLLVLFRRYVKHD